MKTPLLWCATLNFVAARPSFINSIEKYYFVQDELPQINFFLI
jgi:hypothetical protein